MTAGIDAAPEVTGASIELELRGLLDRLSQPERLDDEPLAGRLIPRLRERYPDLAGSANQAILAHGLARLWRETAGAIPLALTNQKLLERFFTLMVQSLYPAQYGVHRFLIESDVRIGPVQSFKDPAVRLGEPEYLALIYADGDLDRARVVWQESGDVLRAITETTIDGLTVHPHPGTVYSRWKAAVQLLAVQVARLLEDDEPAPAPHAAPPTFIEPQLKPSAAEPAPPPTSLAERFAASLAEGLGIAGPAAVIDEALRGLGTPPQGELGRSLAHQLAAIQLGLEPTPEQTPTLSPANVRVALRRTEAERDESAASALWDLQAAGILAHPGDAWQFVTSALAEWFAAEFVATYAGHRFLPQPRYRRLQLWAAEMLAVRQDDSRLARLTADMTAARPGLHAVSVLDMAEIAAVFAGRETPSLTLFRQQLTPALHELAGLASAPLQQALLRLAPHFEMPRRRLDCAPEYLMPAVLLDQAQASHAVEQLSAALGLPAAGLAEARWYEHRPALTALLAQIAAPESDDLGRACAAYLRDADLSALVEVQLGWQWPLLQPVSALDELLRLAREPRQAGWPRALALTVLAQAAHLEQVLNRDTSDAAISGVSLLLLTDRRARWEAGPGRFKLIG